MITTDQERVWGCASCLSINCKFVFSNLLRKIHIPELLKKIELSFHKAVHYLVKRNEEKRSEWIKERLPKIYEAHIKEGWRIFFLR